MTAVGAARYAGSRVSRVEDARLLTGAGTFVDDIVRPGMLHACFVRSPHPRAKIVAIDLTAALELPGVHAVFTPPPTSTATSAEGLVHRDRETRCRTRPDRRWPTARPRFVG